MYICSVRSCSKSKGALERKRKVASCCEELEACEKVQLGRGITRTKTMYTTY